MIRAFILVFLLIGATAGIHPAAAQNAAEAHLEVNLAQVIQDDFRGVNGTYHGFAWMPEQRAKGMDDDDRARELDRVQRCGLHIARTWYRPDWACGESLANEPDWDSAKMRAFYRWLEAMQERGVDVALQTGWWFTQDTYLGRDEPDPAVDVERYAAWVSASVHELVEVRGYGVKYLVLFTEPTSYPMGAVPAGRSEWDYYAEIVTAIHERLLADGRRDLVQLVGPNNTGWGRHVSEAVRDLDPVLDIYSGHDYNLDDYAHWFRLCSLLQQRVAATGKPVWLDEFGFQNPRYRQMTDYGNYIAQAAAASLNAGNQASFIWLLFDQQYVAPLDTLTNNDSFARGVHRWGTCRWPRDTVAGADRPYPHWYAFALLSRFMGGDAGTQVYRTAGTDDVHIAAVRHPDGNWSFLVINATLAPRQVSVRLSAGLNQTLYRYLYDPSDITPTAAAELIGASGVYRNVETGWQDALPVRGVAVYSTIAEP